MLHQINRARGSPEVDRGVRAVVGAAEKSIEPRDVVHVEMRKAHVVKLANLRHAEITQAALSTVEEDFYLTLTGINGDRDCIVAARLSEDLMSNTHPAVSSCR